MHNKNENRSSKRFAWCSYHGGGSLQYDSGWPAQPLDMLTAVLTAGSKAGPAGLGFVLQCRHEAHGRLPQQQLLADPVPEQRDSHVRRAGASDAAFCVCTYAFNVKPRQRSQQFSPASIDWNAANAAGVKDNIHHRIAMVCNRSNSLHVLPRSSVKLCNINMTSIGS